MVSMAELAFDRSMYSQCPGQEVFMRAQGGPGQDGGLGLLLLHGTGGGRESVEGGGEVRVLGSTADPEPRLRGLLALGAGNE